MRAQLWFVASTVLALAACTAEPGSERWCSAKKEQSKTEWSIQDAATLAAHCLIDDTTVGGEAWCKRLAS